MAHLLDEIEANFDAFSAQWKAELSDACKQLATGRDRYLNSYARLTSLNSWREELLSQVIPADSLAFFLEAQNDALVSHVFANMGSWRAALKSLRACIENVLSCLYFKDHPVELELWAKGTFRIGFSELCDYLSRHPLIRAVPRGITGLELIRNEYAVLSRAVHGAAAFRMTAGGDATTLWSSEVKDLRVWNTRESKTIAGLNLLLLVMFCRELQGTAHRGLRTAVGLAVPASKRSGIKASLNVTLPAAT